MWGTLPRRKKHSRIRSEVKEMPGPAGSGRAGIAPPPLQRAAFWDLTSTMQAYHYAALQAVSLAPWVLPYPIQLRRRSCKAGLLYPGNRYAVFKVLLRTMAGDTPCLAQATASPAHAAKYVPLYIHTFLGQIRGVYHKFFCRNFPMLLSARRMLSRMERSLTFSKRAIRL